MLSKTHSKYIQSLHGKKFRESEGLFFAEGSKVVTELIAAGNFTCRELIATEEWLTSHQNWLQQYSQVSVQQAETFEMEKISALSAAPPVLAVFEQKANAAVHPENRLSLVLDTIQDPGNLGTLIRIADWFGISGIICSENCADLYNPKVVQSTMGSLGRVQLYYTDIEIFIRNYPQIPLLAAALDGLPVKEAGTIREAFLVIGNESKGIRPSLLEAATRRITIPRHGDAESLNAAVAAGIILSHIR